MKTKVFVVGDNISCRYVGSVFLVIMQVLGRDCEGEYLADDIFYNE